MKLKPSDCLSISRFFVFFLCIFIFTISRANAAAPTVNITLPTTGTSYSGGDYVSFVGDASDDTSTSLTGESLKWVSDKDGQIGVGGSIIVNTLQSGTHVITLIATDSNSVSGSDSITITIGNNSPTASITTPSDNDEFQAGESIGFIGNGSDLDDSDTLTYQWTSSLDGVIGSSEVISKSDLTVGTHVIVFAVSDGAITTQSSQITIKVVNNAPVATILNPSDGDSFYPGEAINFNGSGTDVEDGTTGLSYSWDCSEHGNLSTSQSFSSSALSAGTHQITFTVKDSLGLANTTKQTISIFIGNHDPVPVISLPSTGTSYDKEDVIIFTGSATDTEDGTLTGSSLSWSSDLQGVIGTGTTFSRNDLVSGTHIITLTASDLYSTPGTASTNIIITINNTFPSVSILNPATGSSYYEGTDVVFSGTGTDPEDGQLSGSSLVWTSSISGKIGEGSPLTVNTLSAGEHEITLTATDSEAASVTSSSIIVTIGNNLPTASISSPTDGSVYYQGDEITFRGSGSDSEDGSLTGNSLTWTSNLDGAIGTGTILTTDQLSIGAHAITLTATDSQGATYPVSVVVTIKNNTPVATIVTPQDNSVYDVGADVTFNGLGVDSEDGQLSGNSLVWVSSIDGQLGTGNAVTTSSLSQGTHLVSFTVTDSNGDQDEKNIVVNIGNNPPVITVSLPVEKDTYLEGQYVSFVSTVVDDEDGVLTGTSVEWISNIDGLIATGSTPSPVNTLSVGTHSITVIATDSNGATTRSTPINIRIGNKSPVVEILSPKDGKAFETGDSILFEGTATDDEDGVLLDTSLVWTSNRQGQIGTGTSFSLNDLVGGLHVITLTATDSDGAESTASISIKAQNALPVATITSPATGSSFDEGVSILFRGTGNDEEDGSLSGESLTWESDWDGSLGTGKTLEIDSLSAGTHIITLTVTDNDGSISTATISVIVVPMTASPTSVSIEKGSTGLITISGGKTPYRVATRRKQIADPVESNGIVTVTGVDEGTTVITVTDNKQNSVVVHVSVTPSGGTSSDKVPEADAGDDKTGVAEGDVVTLTGRDISGSGLVPSFLWTQVDPLDISVALTDPTVKIDNSTASTASFIVPLADISGSTLAFRLSIQNDAGADTDYVMATIKDNGISGFPADTINFYSATGTKLAIKAGELCTVKNIYTENAESYEASKMPVNSIFGVVQGDFKASYTGALISYTVYFPSAVSTDYKWFKYNPVDESWGEYDRSKISDNTENGVTFNEDRTQATVYIKDESEYDLNQEDSIVSDTFALGTGLPSKSSGGSSSGCFIYTIFN